MHLWGEFITVGSSHLSFVALALALKLNSSAFLDFR